MKICRISTAYKLIKKLFPHFGFYPEYLTRSLEHRTSKISTYWFERLCVKRAWDDNFARYLADREPDRMSCHVRGYESQCFQ